MYMASIVYMDFYDCFKIAYLRDPPLRQPTQVLKHLELEVRYYTSTNETLPNTFNHIKKRKLAKRLPI